MQPEAFIRYQFFSEVKHFLSLTPLKWFIATLPFLSEREMPMSISPIGNVHDAEDEVLRFHLIPHRPPDTGARILPAMDVQKPCQNRKVGWP
jgi:hypothetical protein